jgi:hypothetical protein
MVPGIFLVQVLGAWAAGAWYAYVPLTTLLAINRCVALCFQNRFAEIFSKTKTTVASSCHFYNLIYHFKLKLVQFCKEITCPLIF